MLRRQDRLIEVHRNRTRVVTDTRERGAAERGEHARAALRGAVQYTEARRGAGQQNMLHFTNQCKNKIISEDNHTAK